MLHRDADLREGVAGLRFFIQRLAWRLPGRMAA